MARDIVVIGASAGGLTPLCTVIRGLPRDPPCSVFVVLHTGAESVLHEVLRKCGEHRVMQAEDQLPIQTGVVYVAPSRMHLTLTPNKMQLDSGPRENHHRPSIDVLFRSAARHFGPRVVGVILSGALDDGAAGLFSIKSHGGLAVIEDPDEAVIPDMPRAALRYCEVDYCLPAAKIPATLITLMKSEAKEKVPAKSNGPPENSHLVPFVCPDCDGPLYAVSEGKLVQFACVVGHRFSPESLSESHRDALERALWVAIRNLANRKQIHETLAERAEKTGDTTRSLKLRETIGAAERDMGLIKEIFNRL